MQTKLFTPRFIFISISIFIAAISRLLPHPPNFTPIAAMAIFGGAMVNDKRLAFILPLLALLLSDIVIGFHNTILYVYGSFILISFIGLYIRKNANSGNIILASIISSILFFLVTNFGVWAASGFELGLQGLVLTLTAGIPFYSNSIFSSFFLNTVAGDLFYCGILFAAFEFAKSKFPALVKA